MSRVFSSKLDRLAETIAARDVQGIARIADDLTAGSQLRAIAVGSGGSLTSAHYLAACRRDVSPRPTVVLTPLEFVLADDDLSDAQVWLFTGRGENADIQAALTASWDRHVSQVVVVTCNVAASILSKGARRKNFSGHVLKVADEKDGFLSTHSTMATMTALLSAADRAIDLQDADRRSEELRAAVADKLSVMRRGLARVVGEISPDSTVLILADPALAAAAVTLETSIWEAALCTVQRTDYRNFAHGRHVWMTHRGERTQIVSLTTMLTEPIWGEIRKVLPVAHASLELDYRTGGRFEGALAVVDALLVVEAIGNATAVDPGKPGAGPYAKDIYEGNALQLLSASLRPSVRHKMEARRIRDEKHVVGGSPLGEHERLIERFERTSFSALVLDYDGTIVPTEKRFEAPQAEIVRELLRLLDSGVRLGIASGRGGSAGEMLRNFVPRSLQRNVVMGYYNGAYVRTLEVDIRDHPAPVSEIIASMRDWLNGFGLPATARISGVQISIDLADLTDQDAFIAALRNAPLVRSGDVKLAQSKHSVDIGLATSSKLSVVTNLQTVLGNDALVLSIGDSGHAAGNDFELLHHPFGISVDQVSHLMDACWSMFGSALRGPAALFRILSCLQMEEGGTFRLDANALNDDVV